MSNQSDNEGEYKMDNTLEPIEVKTIEHNIENTENENQQLISPRRIHTFNFPEMVGHQETNDINEIENNLLFRYRFAIGCNLFLSCLYSIIISPFYLIYTVGFLFSGMFITHFQSSNKKRVIIFYIGFSLLFMTNIIINGAILINDHSEISKKLGYSVGIYVPLLVTNLVIFKNPFRYLKYLNENTERRV
jgi:hypothetical protein